MDKAQFSELVKRLDAITRLLSLTALGNKSLREQVAILSSVGFSPKQIAEIIGTTSHTVRQTKYELKKKVVTKTSSDKVQMGHDESS